MTPYKEDYLKEIYKMGGENQVISNKQIAQRLGIKPASVTEMINKLKTEDYVSYEPYKGIKLTEKGVKKASFLLRSHRLWEVFLKDYLKYEESKIHDAAEELEHVTPQDLLEKLDEYLNYPEHCPHGSVIPKKR